MGRDWWNALGLPAWLGGGPSAALTSDLHARLEAWHGLPPPEMRRAFTEQRWVVVDVETSGLDIRADRLIAIGAVAVRGNAIDAADSFEVVLRQDAVSSDENILIHGIAASEQRSGTAAAPALLDFLEFMGTDPLIAFHAFFDEAMLRRACREQLGLALRCKWLDLAHLAPAVLNPGSQDFSPGKGLDDWLADFAIPISERHRAVADAVATAQLWLALHPALGRAGVTTCGGVMGLAADYEWLKRREPRA